jgi:uncharacterized protein YuzE
MQIEYDHETDTLYLRLDPGAKREFVNRVLEEEGTFVVFDIDEDDRIAGIEILNASHCVNLSAILPIEGSRAAS